jgi:hypothetical protein
MFYAMLHAAFGFKFLIPCLPCLQQAVAIRNPHLNKVRQWLFD